MPKLSSKANYFHLSHQASLEHHLGDVLRKLLGGDDDDEDGLSGAGVADEDDAHAGLGWPARFAAATATMVIARL